MSEVPNYRDYTLLELYQALNSIQPDGYPAAFAALESELQARETGSRMELIDCYYQLDRARWPEHATALKARIEALGGFETVLADAVSEAVRYRTFWRRFWAQLIDGLVFLVPAMILLLALRPAFDDTGRLNAWIQEILQYAFLLYSILMHARYGQTVGKFVVGVKVVDVNERQDLSFRQAVLRDAVPLLLTVVATLFFFTFGTRYDADGLTGISAILANVVGLITGLWGLTELVTMLFNQKRRAVHDFIAGTVVIRLP